MWCYLSSRAIKNTQIGSGKKCENCLNKKIYLKKGSNRVKGIRDGYGNHYCWRCLTKRRHSRRLCKNKNGGLFLTNDQAVLRRFWGTFGFSTINVVDGETFTVLTLLISIIGQGVWELKLDGVSSSKRMITYFKSEIILHIS